MLNDKIIFCITISAPQNTVYNNLGQECVGVGCSVDLFITNNSFIDLPTIGQVARLTGGEVYKYTYFQVFYLNAIWPFAVIMCDVDIF